MATEGKPSSRHDEPLVFQTRNPPRSEPVAPPQPALPAASWSIRQPGASGIGVADGVAGGGGVSDDHGTMSPGSEVNGVIGDMIDDVTGAFVAGALEGVPPVATQPARRSTAEPAASHRRSISDLMFERVRREADPVCDVRALSSGFSAKPAI
jgi:hypothetical protein